MEKTEKLDIQHMEVPQPSADIDSKSLNKFETFQHPHQIDASGPQLKSSHDQLTQWQTMKKFKKVSARGLKKNKETHLTCCILQLRRLSFVHSCVWLPDAMGTKS